MSEDTISITGDIEVGESEAFESMYRIVAADGVGTRCVVLMTVEQLIEHRNKCNRLISDASTRTYPI